MPSFGRRSLEKLETAHPLLQILFHDVIRYRDCTILEAYRSPERQAQLFEQGATQKRTGGKHNRSPAEAVDVAPWFATAPHIRWDDTRAWYAFGGFVLARAEVVGVRIRWGADWDSDQEYDDHTLIDAPHFEVLL